MGIIMATIKLIQVQDNFRLSILAPSNNAEIELTPDEIDLLYDKLSQIYLHEASYIEMVTEDQE